MGKECFVIIFSHYDDGLMTYAYFNEDDARRQMVADFETEVKSLVAEGYRIKSKLGDWSAEIEVVGMENDIWMNWWIDHTEIQ